ncbi:MAG: hydrogenase maturation protease [Candidatus Bathyarchaeota archaeon]|nr:MAG: hydrogenase maturation protease [Candidatus Bathyarchaeota archaeon]
MSNQPRRDTNKLRDKLRSWLTEADSVVIAGIGNPIRRDDFIGVEIVRTLRGRTGPLVNLLECETAPESFIGQIAKLQPTHVLLIDAGILKQKPGASVLVEPDQVGSESVVSTHALPLQIMCRYLAETTNATIALLLIQPKDATFGEGLTAELLKAKTQLASLLLRLLPTTQ